MVVINPYVDSKLSVTPMFLDAVNYLQSTPISVLKEY